MSPISGILIPDSIRFTSTKVNKVTLFSYGSLMLKQEIERTLGRNLPERNLFPAILKGYKREWSAIRENTASTYKWLIDRHTGVPPRFVAYLNLTADKDSAVQGMAFQIKEHELKRFDRRELGYNRIEIGISDAAGESISAPVFSYIDGIREHVTDDVYISYHYLNLIRSLCYKLESAAKDIRSDYFTKTPLPDACLANLDVVCFSHDFSQLHELRLDRNPSEMQIAAILGNGNVRTHQTIEDIEAMNPRDWSERFVMACQPDLSKKRVLSLESDPCFLVRSVLAYRVNKDRDMETLLKHHMRKSMSAMKE